MLVCLLSSPDTFSCFIVTLGWKYSVCMRVRAKPLHTPRSRCDCFGMEGDAVCVCSYRGETRKGKRIMRPVKDECAH